MCRVNANGRSADMIMNAMYNRLQATEHYRYPIPKVFICASTMHLTEFWVLPIFITGASAGAQVSKFAQTCKANGQNGTDGTNST